MIISVLNVFLDGLKILWDLKILWESAFRRAKFSEILSQCEVWLVSLETDQLIRIHSFAFSLRSCQNWAVFAQRYKVKQLKFDSLCRIVVFCVCTYYLL